MAQFLKVHLMVAGKRFGTQTVYNPGDELLLNIERIECVSAHAESGASIALADKAEIHVWENYRAIEAALEVAIPRMPRSC